jgi:hypothetical protein
MRKSEAPTDHELMNLPYTMAPLAKMPGSEDAHFGSHPSFLEQTKPEYLSTIN